MYQGDRDALLSACHVLFGHRMDPPFLLHLRESGVRSAWRRKALQTHPDRTVDGAAKPGHAEAFIEARRAYGVLLEFLARRGQGREPAARAAHAPARPPHRPPAERTRAHRRGQSRPQPSVPFRRLRLGEFLYHARVIPFATLIEALVWQRRQRSRFCEVGQRWGLLSEPDVAQLLGRRLPHERVGAAAERLRLLTSFQVRTVLAFQRSRQEPLGSYFVSHGLLTPQQLERHLRLLEDHNRAVRRR
jgi:hypothetical protein